MPSSAEVKWLLLMQLSRKKMKGVRRGVEESHARSLAKLFLAPGLARYWGAWWSGLIHSVPCLLLGDFQQGKRRSRAQKIFRILNHECDGCHRLARSPAIRLFPVK